MLWGREEGIFPLQTSCTVTMRRSLLSFLHERAYLGNNDSQGACGNVECDVRMMGVECRVGLPVFDVILLGLGPDGHVASLFPNRSQLAATDAWVLPIENSPKPPPERITFSLPVINRSVTHPPPLSPTLVS